MLGHILQEPAEPGLSQILLARDLDVPEEFSWPFKEPIWVGQLSAIVETEIDVVALDYDVAEVLRHLPRPVPVADHTLPRPWHLDHGREHLPDQKSGTGPPDSVPEGSTP